MDVVWKDVKGYEGLYQVSSEGDVKAYPRSGSRGGLLKRVMLSGGSYMFYLCKKNKRYAHRIEELMNV